MGSAWANGARRTLSNASTVRQCAYPPQASGVVLAVASGDEYDPRSQIRMKVMSVMQTTSLIASLIAGLTGALISAAFSFGIRWYLDGRAQKIAEKKIAYVHFVAVSEVVAMEILVKKHFDALGVTEKYGGLRDPKGAFEPSHKASVLLSAAIMQASPDRLRYPEGHSFDPRLMRRIQDGLKQSQLTAEQVSKLPKETIIATIAFQSSVAQLAGYVDQWTDLLETGARDWVNPGRVHEHWLAIIRFVASARALRSAMVSAGVVTGDEANALLLQQLAVQAKSGFGSTLDAPGLEAAAQDDMTEKTTNQ